MEQLWSFLGLCLLTVTVEGSYSINQHHGLQNIFPNYEQQSSGCDIPHFKFGSIYPRIPQNKCPVKTQLSFFCEKGYSLRGPKTAVCGYDGAWDPPQVPVCYSAKYCSKPVAPTHGTYGPIMEKYPVGTNCYYKCKPGFVLTGYAKSTCLDTGYWSYKQAVKCVDKDECSAHVNVCGPYAKCVNLVGSYKCICKEGYKLIHGKCHPEVCYQPKLHQDCGYTPKYQKSWKVGQQIYFHCPTGYELQGYKYATCLAGGKWDNESPLCYKRKMCYVPVLPKNCGYTPQHQTTWYAGQKISFYCPKGYTMKGAKYATCSAYGKWDNNPPSCYPPPVCYLPKLHDNCGYTPKYQKSWNLGHKIYFYCPTGYDLIGQKYAICIDGGKWDNEAPTCYKRKVCYLPVLPKYCGYSPQYQKVWQIGQKITYRCPPGYGLKGSVYATCNNDGKWDNAPPTCHKREVCYVPQMQRYCTYSPKYQKTWNVGHKIHFKCPDGFQLKGYSESTCLAGGKWSHHPPLCQRAVCYAPKLRHHAYFYPRYTKYWYAGQKVKYLCPPGYQLKGYAYATCRLDGTWDKPAPICYKKNVYCTLPALKPNCRLSTPYKTYYRPGDVTGFACPRGFTLKGYSSSKCLYNGRWSHPPPICHYRVYGYGVLHHPTKW